MDIDTVLDQVERDLASAAAEAEALNARVAELQTVRTGLRVAMDRYGLSASREPDRNTARAEQAPQRVPVIGSVTSMSRTDAVLHVLTVRQTPTSIVQARDELHAMGRDDDHEQVRNALHYLTRVEKLDRAGRGLFVLPASSKAKEASAVSAAQASVAAIPREGGDASGASGEVSHRDHDEGTSWQANHRALDVRTTPVGG